MQLPGDCSKADQNPARCCTALREELQNRESWKGSVTDRSRRCRGKSNGRELEEPVSFLGQRETIAILTNDKAASAVRGAQLNSGFQSTFEEMNGNIYLINVCRLCGENVLLSHLEMFRRSLLLWQSNEAAVGYDL